MLIHGNKNDNIYSQTLGLLKLVFLRISEIIHRVKIEETPPFRPNTNTLICEEYISNCIHDCWNENPDERPDFKYIKYRLKQMHQGLYV